MNDLIDNRFREIINEINEKKCLVNKTSTVICFLSNDLSLGKPCSILEFHFDLYPTVIRTRPETIISDCVGKNYRIVDINDQSDRIRKFYNLYREFVSRESGRVI